MQTKMQNKKNPKNENMFFNNTQETWIKFTPEVYAKSTYAWHVLRNTRTAEKPQKTKLKLTVLFCFPVTGHVNDEMSV